MNYLILIAGVFANAGASVLIKIAMQSPTRQAVLSQPLTLLTNWPLLAGLALYGMAFVLYALALTRLPLSVAHPTLTAGAIALVAVIGWFGFNEPMVWTRLAGIAFVLIGVVLLSWQPVH